MHTEQAGFVAVFSPADVQQLVQARMALEGSTIPFHVHNEQVLYAMGLPFALGAQRAVILVPAEFAEDAGAVLEDWFATPAEPNGEREDTPDRRGVMWSVAAPFLLLVGLILPELAIVLGRRSPMRATPSQRDD